jgi:uncharacterized protein (TIGR02246 family)
MSGRIACVMLIVLAAVGGAQTPADEATIRARIAAHGAAAAAGDARALAEVYADDAELVSRDGSVVQGRKAIDALWKEEVAEGAAQGGRYHMHPPESIHVRFVSPDVAIVDVGSRSLGGRDSTGAPLPVRDAALLTVWRKEQGTWRVVYQRSMPSPN